MDWMTPLVAGLRPVDLALAAGVLIVLLLAWYFRRPLKRRWEAFRTRRTLHRLGYETLERVVVPDGMGGTVLVEYMVLTPGGVVVVDVKDFAGVIFAADRIDEWTQTVGRRSYKFPNPLPDNQLKVQAVQDHLSEVPVHGRVAFTRQGRFATGLPYSVSMLDGLREDLAELREGEVPPGYLADWLDFKKNLPGLVTTG